MFGYPDGYDSKSTPRSHYSKFFETKFTVLAKALRDKYIREGTFVDEKSLLVYERERKKEDTIEKLIG